MSARWVVGVLAVVVARPALATTVVGLTERTAVGQAEAAVVGRVVETRDARDGTVVTLAVEEVLRGRDVPGTVRVRLPGGGTRVVAGAPAARAGERVLVLLVRAPAGWLTPVGLGVGWYRIRGDAARRDGGEDLVGVDGRRHGARRTVPLARLRALVARGPDGASIAVAAARTEAIASAPAATDYTPGHGRWFEPDAGLPVAFRVDARGDRALGLLRSLDALGAAMAAWNAVPGASLVLRTAGLVPAGRATDGSVVRFDDPAGEIPQPRRCAGILALGGYRTAPDDVRRMDGVDYARITAGEVTLADGWAGCPIWRRTNVAEVLAHELGHAVGLHHSADGGALMFPRAHLDGRGAALAADDARALRALYPAAAPALVAPTLAVPSVALTGPSLRADVRYDRRGASVRVRVAVAIGAAAPVIVLVGRDGTTERPVVRRLTRVGAFMRVVARGAPLSAPPPIAVRIDGAPPQSSTGAPCVPVSRARLRCRRPARA